jgi:hypothetical protein
MTPLQEKVKKAAIESAILRMDAIEEFRKNSPLAVWRFVSSVDGILDMVDFDKENETFTVMYEVEIGKAGKYYETETREITFTLEEVKEQEEEKSKLKNA